MKRYRIGHYQGDRPKPYYLTQLSKSGKYDGVRIWFLSDGRKHYQAKYKNDLLNGVEKWFMNNSKNWFFINWKKGDEQGIKIDFK